ncbi:MAG: hypothetical protein JWN68_2683 [Nocardioides sp.]|uniref:hypothetical protein n=1 Tax=Nocardioides sp. TaxID=35761 RepID=UPI002613671D|nr:hypothetical protein [Nocardioides sp.]MCW2834730.1 hypothetical protein [Nocardioides sp.]
MSTELPAHVSGASGVPPLWSGFLDDAAVFPPGNAALPDAVAAFRARRDEWYADLVASLVVTDERVPAVSDPDIPLSIVVTGGAGAIAGALRLAVKAGNPVAGLEIALRDPDDLAGNARRVVAAVDAARVDGLLDDETPVFVELPPTEVTHGWESAADEVAGAELRLKFRTGGVEAHFFPSTQQVAAWIDAALDREVAFKCTAGLHNAVRHRDPETGFEHHGFLNVLVATQRLFDGGSDAMADLEESDASALLDRAADVDLARARRWFTGIGSCSILEPLADLTDLGLMERP